MKSLGTTKTSAERILKQTREGKSMIHIVPMHAKADIQFEKYGGLHTAILEMRGKKVKVFTGNSEELGAVLLRSGTGYAEAYPIKKKINSAKLAAEVQQFIEEMREHKFKGETPLDRITMGFGMALRMAGAKTEHHPLQSEVKAKVRNLEESLAAFHAALGENLRKQAKNTKNAIALVPAQDWPGLAKHLMELGVEFQIHRPSDLNQLTLNQATDTIRDFSNITALPPNLISAEDKVKLIELERMILKQPEKKLILSVKQLLDILEAQQLVRHGLTDYAQRNGLYPR